MNKALFNSVFRHGRLAFAQGEWRNLNPYDPVTLQADWRDWDEGWCAGFDENATKLMRAQMRDCGEVYLYLIGDTLHGHGDNYHQPAGLNMFTFCQKFTSAEAAERYGNFILWTHDNHLPEWLVKLCRRGILKLAKRLKFYRQIAKAKSVCVCCNLKVILTACPRHSMESRLPL